MKFEKWQALGNDYLILERDELAFELTPARIRKLCAPHFGVFADGVLLLSHSADPEVVADLRIYNPDGSEAELSGNGAREAILYLRRRGWTEHDSFAIDTAAGRIRPQITGRDTCRVDMGRASLASKDFPGGASDGRGELAGAHFQHVSIGNPQCAIHVSDLATLQALDLPAIGPAIEGHALFPNRTNVSWYTEIGVAEGNAAGSVEGETAEPAGGEVAESARGEVAEPAGGEAFAADAPPRARIRARIFERGVGETLSSGTGATGAAIAYALQSTGVPASVLVELDGGELQVDLDADLRVHLTGWARPVFTGCLSEDFIAELCETKPPSEGAA
ncbi:MAG TPA: diaminopimelate epimerase [Solirubrobacteraceae bacterium]|jgi:diaminopimelate epimerase